MKFLSVAFVVSVGKVDFILEVIRINFKILYFLLFYR